MKEKITKDEEPFELLPAELNCFLLEVMKEFNYLLSHRHII